MASYPHSRPRRNRKTPWSRALVAEHSLRPENLVWPVFVQEGERLETPIASMPGVVRMSADMLVEKAAYAVTLGIPAVALFPVIAPEQKTAQAEEAFRPDNLLCRTVRRLRKEVPHIGIICDVALDPYTIHGHDGLMIGNEIDNDLTVQALCRQAVVQAEAGCDIIAPSDMMDGRVGAIRAALDGAGFVSVQILSYAVKYASAFYGPFREAVGSAKQLGKADKRTYQMDPANALEALREVQLDIDEGADMVMVKPGLPYLDIIHRIRAHCALPVLAYQVSGEYAMIKAAAEKGWIDGIAVMQESLLAFKRAGASAIITYAAIDVAERLTAAR